MTHRTEEEVGRLFDTSVNPPGHKSGQVKKHDTPRSPHREHDPRTRIEEYAEIGGAGFRDRLVESLQEHPKEAARIRVEAQRWLKGQNFGETVTIYHVTEEGDDAFRGGVDPYTSWTVGAKAVEGIAAELFLENPRVLAASVPRESITVAMNASFPESPYAYQDEVMLDSSVPFKELQFPTGFNLRGFKPPMRKAPGIDESGAEPNAGYRLGSPPTAQPASRWRRQDDDKTT